MIILKILLASSVIMELIDINYDEFINEFHELCCVKARENTKHETIVRIGNWRNKNVALKNCYRKSEALLYSNIRPHPNIVRLLTIIYQTIPEKKKPRTYILMEANDGVTLADTAMYNVYSLFDVLYIMIEITKGLQHLHSCGFIHHDIKRSNILVVDKDKLNKLDTVDKTNKLKESDDDYESYFEEGDDISQYLDFKICDFGLSEYIDSNGCGSEKFRNCGTKLYLAPEKTKGSSIPITSKVDIFAMGVLGTNLMNPDESSSDIDVYNRIMDVCKSVDLVSRYTAEQLLDQLTLLQIRARAKLY